MLQLINSSTAQGSGTSRGINKPTNTADGDIMLMSVVTAVDTAVTMPGGWTLIDEIAGTYAIHVYYRVASSEGSSYTINFNDTTAHALGCITWRSDTGASFSINATAKQSNGADTSHVAPQVSPTQIDAQLHCFYSGDANTTWTAPAGMTKRWDTTQTGVDNTCMIEFYQSKGATGTRTATTSGSVSSRAIIVALTEDVAAPSLYPLGVTSNQASITTSNTVDRPASVAQDDLMLLSVCTSSNATITDPSGWTLLESILATVVGGSADNRLNVYYKIAGASEPSNYTVTHTLSTSWCVIVGWRSDGAYTIVVEDSAQQENKPASTSQVAPSVTTTRSNAQLCCFFNGENTLAGTQPTGMVERFENTGAPASYLMTELVAGTGATGTRTLTSNSQTSVAVSVAIAEDVPTGPDADPTSLTATAINHGRIDLEWVDNSSNEDGFSIERSPNGTDTWAEIDTVAANETTYSDTGLTEYTNYWYRVRAFTTGPTYSDYSNTATDQTLLAAPSGLTATANGDIQIDLEWTINSAVPPDGTAIERSPNGSTGWTEIATVAHPTNTYGNSGLNPETTYHYRVRSYKVEA